MEWAWLKKNCRWQKMATWGRSWESALARARPRARAPTNSCAHRWKPTFEVLWLLIDGVPRLEHLSSEMICHNGTILILNAAIFGWDSHAFGNYGLRQVSFEAKEAGAAQSHVPCRGACDGHAILQLLSLASKVKIILHRIISVVWLTGFLSEIWSLSNHDDET